MPELIIKSREGLTLSSPRLRGGGGEREGAESAPQMVFFIMITLEQFKIQSSNYTTFPKILQAIFPSVFQHYPRSPVAMVTDNLQGTFSIFECFIL